MYLFIYHYIFLKQRLLVFHSQKVPYTFHTSRIIDSTEHIVLQNHLLSVKPFAEVSYQNRFNLTNFRLQSFLFAKPQKSKELR